MIRTTISALVLGLTLFGCTPKSEDPGTGNSRTGGSGGGASSSGGTGGGSSSTGGSGSSTGGSGGGSGPSTGGTGGGTAGTGGSSTATGGSGASTGGAGGSSTGGSSGTGGASSTGGAGGGTGGAGPSTGDVAGETASSGPAATFKKQCFFPVMTGWTPDEFCSAYGEICTFGGAQRYKDLADCKAKFKGLSSDADGCKAGHLCRAFKEPAMKEADCASSSGAVACRN